MDEQLAQIYGTGQTYDAEDLEKTAAAELLVKLAAEQGVDLNDFSEEDIAEMLGELYSEKTAEEEKKEEAKEETKEEAKEEKKEEAKEKVAEADYLGRVMAHAYVQEINNIEKEAAGKMEAARAAVGKGVEAVRGAASRFGGRYKPSGEALKEVVKGTRAGGRSGSTLFLTKGERTRSLLEAAKKAPGEVKGTVAGLAGLGAYQTGKHRGEKNASALETLIEKRAFEILAGNGWVSEQGEVIAPPQAEETKEASALEQTVEVEALRLLEANGYPVEWNQ